MKVASITEELPGASGLTSFEAAHRLASAGPNELARPPRPSLVRRIAGELLEPLVVLLLVAAAGESSQVAAGTSVTRGRGSAIVTATGTRTAVGRIAGALEERPPTSLQRELAGVARLLGLATVVVAAGVLGLLLLRLGDTVTADEAFLTAVALAVTAVPEGLATVTAVALAIGVRHMADHGAIVRRLPAVETLGSTTVLVFDKTGTLTENRLRVDGIAWVDGRVGRLADLPPLVLDATELVASLCSDAEPGQDHGDPVEAALLGAVGPRQAACRRAAWPRVASIPFSSEQGLDGHRASPGRGRHGERHPGHGQGRPRGGPPPLPGRDRGCGRPSSS